MAVGTAPVDIFDADLPTLTYDATETPVAVYPRIFAAQRQAPIALGPFGPEVLSYHLVRSYCEITVSRSPRGSIWLCRVLLRDHSGTRWSVCSAWKATHITACAA
jgi:hypothetical protein